MMNKRRFWRYQFPAIVWAALIFVLSSLPGWDVPVSPPLHLDKAFHAAIFFVFCFLLNRAFLNQGGAPSLSKYHLIISLIIVIAYGASDELHQMLVPGRSPDVLDALADSFGGLVCSLYLFLAKVQTARRLNSAQNPGSREP